MSEKFTAGMLIRIKPVLPKSKQYHGKIGVIAAINNFNADAEFIAVKIDGAILHFQRTELEEATESEGAG